MTGGKTIGEIRRNNLIRLIDEAGGRPALCRRTEVSDAYISLVINRRPSSRGKPRQLGDKVARKIEVAMGKPAGWMDASHSLGKPLDPAMKEFRYFGTEMSPEVIQGDVIMVNTDIPISDSGIKIAAFEATDGSLVIGRYDAGRQTLHFPGGGSRRLSHEEATYLGCVVSVRRTY